MACRKPRVLRFVKDILMFILGQKYSRVADGTEPMKNGSSDHPISFEENKIEWYMMCLTRSWFE